MILDKILLSNINTLGDKFLKNIKLGDYPKSINEMKMFLDELRRSIYSDEFEGVLIGQILFSFVSNKEIRDRNSTSRIFEDIFAALFSLKSTDKSKRTNPESTEAILSLDNLCLNEDWKISTDLSGNKREKADLILGNYKISLKTLKGQVIGPNNIIEDRKVNDELNVGSLSYRALLKGILPDEQIKNLGDRKSGLGSAKQLRNNIFNPILSNGKRQEFLGRLNLYLNYIFEDDIYIVLKSHYRIDFILIPNESFKNSLVFTYKDTESEFEKIFYRWENNNLRIKWPKMLEAMDKYNLNYFRIPINLEKSLNNKDFADFKKNLSIQIEKYIKKYQTK